MRVLGLSGSLRRASYNTLLLRAAADALPPGDGIELHEALAGIPPFDEDVEDRPAPLDVARLRRAIARADAVLIATPEYNGSIPGQLKNALDWVSRPYDRNPLRGKPVAVVGASTGLFGAVWAQADLRRVLGVLGADVVDLELPVGQAEQAFDADGRLVDDEHRRALGEVLGALRERSYAASGTPLRPTARS